MKPPLFDYVSATSIDMAVAALADAGGEAKILAGGQSLMPMLNFRLLRPSVLVDINRIPGLGFIEETADCCPHRRADAPLCARNLAAHCPAFAGSVLRDDACGASRDPQSRHHRRQSVACRSGRRTADDGAAARCQASHCLGVRHADGRGPRFFSRHDDGRSRRHRTPHRDRAAETATAHRLGIRGSREAPRRFCAGRGGRDTYSVRWQDRASPHCFDRRRPDGVACRRSRSRCWSDKCSTAVWPGARSKRCAKR